MYNAQVKNYRREAIKTQLAAADGYEVIQMLMAGALEKMALARAAIENNSKEAKSEHISRASAIIIALRDCLDFEVGGEISENLAALYSYMLDILTSANVSNDVSKLTEASSLLKEVKSAWDQIPMQTRQETLAS